MKSFNNTQKMVIGALFISLGVVIPQAFHNIPNAGMVLLPMHIPILLCGLICGWQYGLLTGILTPILSSLLTGMPGAAVLPGMIFELAVYGGLAGFLYSRIHTGKTIANIYISLLTSMLFGRIVGGILNAFIFRAGNYSLQIWMASSFITALPGIIAQLIIIPTLVTSIDKSMIHNSNNKKIPTDLSAIEQAKALIALDGTSCVVVRDGKIIYRLDGRGISPIMRMLQENPEILKDSYIVDRIIGKAAAMLLELGGAYGAYGDTISKAAREYMSTKDFKLECNRCIDVISNREGNGICPMEKTVLDISDPFEAYEKLKKTVSTLKNKSSVG